VKNVAGYDLLKLFIGGHDSLGLIVEATFKLLPLPEAEHCAQGGPGRERPCSCAWVRPCRREAAPSIPEKSDGLVRIVVAGCAAGITMQLGGSMLAGAADS